MGVVLNVSVSQWVWAPDIHGTSQSLSFQSTLDAELSGMRATSELALVGNL